MKNITRLWDWKGSLHVLFTVTGNPFNVETQASFFFYRFCVKWEKMCLQFFVTEWKIVILFSRIQMIVTNLLHSPLPFNRCVCRTRWIPFLLEKLVQWAIPHRIPGDLQLWSVIPMSGKYNLARQTNLYRWVSLNWPALEHHISPSVTTALLIVAGDCNDTEVAFYPRTQYRGPYDASDIVLFSCNEKITCQNNGTWTNTTVCAGEICSWETVQWSRCVGTGSLGYYINLKNNWVS